MYLYDTFKERIIKAFIFQGAMFVKTKTTLSKIKA